MYFSCAPQLWIVSDGGLCQDIGYYGWVIANDTSIIWEGRGQVPGNNTQFDLLGLKAVDSYMLLQFSSLLFRLIIVLSNQLF